MKRRTVFAILVLSVFILMSAFALAQPERTEATLIALSGRVIVVPDGGLLGSTPEKIVTPDQAVLVWAGDEIRVGENAAAQLRLFDGSTVDLAANTTLQITELYTDQENYRVQLSLTAGKLLSRVKRILGSSDTFDITTPSSTASVRGTVFTVTVIAPDVTYISCTEGTVAVQMGAASALVPAGTELTATVGQPLHVVPLSETDSAAAPEPFPTAALAMTPLPGTTPTFALQTSPGGVSNPAENQPINTPLATSTSTTGPSTVAPTNQPTFLPTHTHPGSIPNLPTNTAVPFNPTSEPTSLPPTPVPVSSTTLTPVPPTPMPHHTPTAAPTAVTVPTQAPTAAPTATTVPTQIPTATAAPTQPPTATPVPPSSTPVPSNTPEPSPTSGGGEPQITICHKPNGPNNGQTMTIPESALPAHLGHGDTIGPCP